MAKIMQYSYSCVTFHVKPPKITISDDFNMIFYFRDKIQDGHQEGTIVGDVTGLQQRHLP